MSAVWPMGWRSIIDGERDALASQILSELTPDHILFSRQFTPIARRDDQDDVLLQLDDGEIAEMHLTWSKQVSPSFPGAILYVDVNAWREAQY